MALIKHGVRSCPQYLMCFIANIAARASLRCASSFCFGLAPKVPDVIPEVNRDADCGDGAADPGSGPSHGWNSHEDYY
jgi:hypothetical protein